MKTKGYMCGIFAAFTWGTVFVVGRFILRDGNVNPLIIGFYRCFFASIFLLILLRKQLKEIRNISPGDYLYLLLLAFTGIFLFNALVFYSLKYTTATSSSILMNANPIFILIFATLFIREKMTLGKVFAVILGFIGCVMVIKGTGENSSGVMLTSLKGNFFALGSAVCWALYTVFGNSPSRKYGAVITTFVTLSTGMLFFLSVMLIMRINFWNITLPVIVSGAYLGIVPAGIGFTLWYNALRYLEAGELGIFQYIASVVTAVFSIVFLREFLNILMLTGMFLVILSLYIPRILNLHSART